MKSLLLHIKSWLLVIYILSDGAAPLLWPEEFAAQNLVMEQMEKESEPTDTKHESKSSSDKLLIRYLIYQHAVAAKANRRFFEKQYLATSQIFQPVITPPPKALS